MSRKFINDNRVLLPGREGRTGRLDFIHRSRLYRQRIWKILGKASYIQPGNRSDELLIDSDPHV